MDKLDALFPPFAAKVRSVLAGQSTSGLPPYDIFMGLRTWEEQNRLYALGRTVRNPDGYPTLSMGRIVTKAKGGDSFHNYGLAADIVFRPHGNWSWDDSLPWEKLGKLGEGLGLEWGGRWKFQDLPHFQMLGRLASGTLPALAFAKRLYADGGLSAVWDAV